MIGKGGRGDGPSLVERLRERHGWLDHLVRAAGRYQQRYGDHYAAAITYFSVLSLVPLLMIAFAVGGFVLADQPELLRRAQEAIAGAVPDPSLRETLSKAVGEAVEQRYSVGAVGLVVALYSGLGWMSNLRDALTAQWDQDRPDRPFLRGMVVDLLALVGLGIALVVSFGITAGGSQFADDLLGWLGWRDGDVAKVVLAVSSVVLALLANWLVFLWVLSRLPREPVSVRSAMRGALVAAVGFELLKQVGTLYLGKVTGSPSGAAFGSLLGLLVFVYLVARFLLFVTAWTATSPENARPKVVPPPPPAVIRPVVAVRSGPSGRTALGLLGVGALLGVALRNLVRRRG
ncbi:membrane protein [Streptoalloteichus tenebrarius]|uniref:Membrane protein n=1 Tax=Streptoalloteichus tenebrarius (strain ATCC 17920 / DSM 40477 / JCM 4838 / CBS 697.72 / NBRC 16177 / NCIMB 11028 / NRRL B-12390 / A12253. 1 / ISP 5477) TaxID=1933 RepID=A0ABT1HYA8_STRSD|nr:inner membrane protein YhjD [Streptoalloteichus tenebrarius]MCP2260500.1 membrane protein [Streptoalloteichus tenebrarius]BFF02702.1 inner membrane protein YhjD [Streptoalloteichus tenebrarius]